MGGNPKTDVQKAPGTESGRLGLDLSPEIEISQAEVFRAPDVAEGRRICGWLWENAAVQIALGKGKFTEVGSGRRISDLRGFVRLREEG